MEMGSSSSSSQSPESFTGLKIGQKVYFEDAGIGVPAKSDGGLSSTGGLPPKKGRSGVVQGGQRPRCQVEGCKADLSDVKAYYSRHKVCGMHSKSPMVIVAGLQQRFCQQCSRFHQLPEFDQGKRSCRRRLAGHNERRRKPPPRSLLSTRFGNLSSFILENNSRAGGFLMDFTTYPRLNGRDSGPTTRASVFGNQPTAIAKFLPHPWQSNPENPPPDHLQGSANGTRYPGLCIPPEGFFSGVSDSNCALSLLSNQSSSSRNQALSLGANYLLNSNGSRTVQPAATHGAPINHFSGTWGFKGNEASNGSHELHSDLGLCQISHPASGQYCGEVELAQQSGRQYMEVEHSRAYDSSGQHMDWLL